MRVCKNKQFNNNLIIENYVTKHKKKGLHKTSIQIYV